MKILLTSLVCLTLLLSSPVHSSDRLAVNIRPSVALAPAYVIVRTVVEASAENRRMRLVADSNDFFSSSEIQLDGERSARVREWVLSSLPEGRYQITATLLGPKGEERATASQWFQAAGPGGR